MDTVGYGRIRWDTLGYVLTRGIRIQKNGYAKCASLEGQGTAAAVAAAAAAAAGIFEILIAAAIICDGVLLKLAFEVVGSFL